MISSHNNFLHNSPVCCSCCCSCCCCLRCCFGKKNNINVWRMCIMYNNKYYFQAVTLVLFEHFSARIKRFSFPALAAACVCLIVHIFLFREFCSLLCSCFAFFYFCIYIFVYSFFSLLSAFVPPRIPCPVYTVCARVYRVCKQT